MQTAKQTTGPGKRAKDYVTIVQEACNKVTGLCEVISQQRNIPSHYSILYVFFNFFFINHFDEIIL